MYKNIGTPKNCRSTRFLVFEFVASDVPDSHLFIGPEGPNRRRSYFINSSRRVLMMLFVGSRWISSIGRTRGRLAVVLALFTVTLVQQATVTAAPPSVGLVPLATARNAPAEAADGKLTTVRGTVTAFSGWKQSFFLQDATGAISVDRLEKTRLQPGDQVEVTGRIKAGLFANTLISKSVEVVRSGGQLPRARPSTYGELLTGKYDSLRVEVNGTVQTANVRGIWGRRMLFLDIQTAGGTISAYVLNFAGVDASSWVGGEVRMTGVCGTIFNDKRQLIGLRLFVDNLGQAEIVSRASDLDAVPISPLNSLLTFNGPQVNQRVHVQGVVTFQAANGGDLFLQEGSSAIRIVAPATRVAVGMKVDAWGFLSNRSYSPELKNPLVRVIGPGEPVSTKTVGASDVIRPEFGFVQAPFDGMVVQLEGTIVGRMPSADSILLNLTSGGVGFQARIPDAPEVWALGLESGTTVRITGICVAETDETSTLRSFHILARSKSDVEVIHAAFWNQSLLVLASVDVLILIAGILLLLVERRQDWTPRRKETNLTGGRVKSSRRWSDYLILFALATAAVPVAAECLGFQRTGAGQAFLRATPVLLTALAMWFSRLNQSRAVQLAGISGSGFCALTGGTSLVAGLLHFELPQLLDNFAGINLATAVAMALTGCATLCIRSARNAGAGQVLAVIVACNSLQLLIGSVFGVATAGGLATQMLFSPQNAAGFLALAVSILLRNPEQGFMKAACGPRLGGLMLRRALPAAIAAPILLGWLRLQLQIFGLIDLRFGLTLFCMSLIVCFCLILWMSAIVLNHMDYVKSQAEDALRERERKLELIFETGATGDLSWDVKSDKVTAHASVWRMYGEQEKHPSEAAEWFGQRQHPDDLPRIEEEMNAMRKEQRPFDLEFRVIWPDSSVHWIGCRSVGAFDQQGTMVQVNGINVDITDRKQAEARLLESYALFRELQDSMPQIVWTSSPSGEIQHYNRQWFEYTGLQPGDAWSMVVLPEQLEIMGEQWIGAVAGSVPYETEIALRRASDGQYRWHLARAIPIFDRNGVIKQWFGTFTDIHDFKLAGEEIALLNRDLERRVEERTRELAQTEHKFRLLVESVKDHAIYMLDAEGNVASWNEGAERLKGYTAAEAIGRHCSSFYSARDIAVGAPERHLTAAREAGGVRHEAEVIRKDGGRFWASISISAIHSEDGRLQGFSKVIHDMTGRRLAEDLLIAAEKQAQEANLAKSNFLAAMSHEIRTPMNAILGMADLLWETDLAPKQREYVGRFRRAGTNLLTLVNDILDLSKIEAGRFELESIDFDLLEIVDRVMEIAAPAATLKNISIETQFTSGTSVYLNGDPVRLQQVLNNLLSNAVKFTLRGKIVLRVATHVDGTAGHLQFAVSDSGIGIPADKLEAIFDDFTQAESSTTRRFGGTGLGLGICRRLAEKMQGTVVAESQPGEGSTFYFDAVFSLAARAPETPAKELGNLVGKPVLVVDDNATNRIILCEMCASWGMVTSAASTGEEALAAIVAAKRAASPFSLIVLDRVLPNTEGFSVLREIRQIDRAVPVIISSSDNQSGDLRTARSYGAAAYLLKPIRRSELLSAVVDAISTETKPASAASSAPATPGIAMKILVAEDSEDNRFLVEAYLAGQAFALTFASNGLEAVDLFSKGTFDLILMDVQMPVMDGLTATAAIRALELERGSNPVAIVALTANALTEDCQRSREAGCDAHLAKPISKDQLIGAIDGFRGRSAVANAPTNASTDVPTDVPPDVPPDAPPMPAEPPPPTRFEIKIPVGFETLSRRYIWNQVDKIAKARKALVRRDLDELSRVGHDMKGTGTPYGFHDLSLLGASIESAARAADLELLAARVDEMEVYVRRAVAYLSE